jgi:hypothetical protein
MKCRHILRAVLIFILAFLIIIHSSVTRECYLVRKETKSDFLYVIITEGVGVAQSV